MGLIPEKFPTSGQHLPSYLPVHYLLLSHEVATVGSWKCQPSPPQWQEQTDLGSAFWSEMEQVTWLPAFWL